METKGLKKMRSNPNAKSPTHTCENCGCNRYAPCTCQKKVIDKTEVSA